MPRITRKTERHNQQQDVKPTFSRWIRLYTEILNDYKVQSLSPEMFRGWINLLLIAGGNNGKIPRIDDISFILRMSQHDAQRMVDGLIDVGLIDVMPDWSWRPHNWDKRQFRWDCDDPTNAQRQKRHRNRRSNAPRNGRVTDEVTQNDSALLCSASKEGLNNNTNSVTDNGVGDTDWDEVDTSGRPDNGMGEIPE